jgi:hypothetical protein
LFGAADVSVHVDDAGQNVMTAQIDFAAAGFELGAQRVFLGAAG